MAAYSSSRQKKLALDEKRLHPPEKPTSPPVKPPGQTGAPSQTPPK